MHKTHPNIRWGYILSFFIELYLPVAVWFFFYSRFLSVQEIALLTGFQVIIWNLFEVPSGAFADIVGRRISIFIAFALYALAMFFTTFATVFWTFMIIEFIKGLANAMGSGSLEALLYDSLKDGNQESHWDKVVANNETLMWVGLFIASITGGFLFYYSPTAPYVLQTLIYLAGAGIALKLIEPKRDSIKYNLKNALTQNTQGFKELFATIPTTRITLILAIIGAGYLVAAEILGISQAKEYGMDSRAVGILFGTGYIISATASQAYPALKRRLGPKKLVMIVALLLISTFIFAHMVGVILGSALIILRISSSTTFRNVKSSLLNRFISSKNRASALSSMQLLTQMPYAIFAYLIGGYIDATSPNQFALLLGIILIILLSITLVLFIPKPHLIKARV
jgi:MFS family permease